MENNNVKRRILSAVAIGGAVLIAGTGLALNGPDQVQNESKVPALNLKVDEATVDRDQPLTNSFAPIVQKVARSVVKIFVRSATTQKRLMSGQDFNFFRRFFGDRGFGPMIPWQPGTVLEHGLASGVIVSSDGYILTNNHVVQNAKELQVTLNDGRTFNAKVIGTDPQTDIALIKIDADKLPALTLADSDKVEVGDVVLAVGNPFGIGQTVTSGIVSATNRVTSSDMDEDFIQTDAAINPGNSGGALVDTQGRLIGINSEILTHSGGNQGIGFAVPSNLCRWVMDNLVKYGHVNRGFLGVEIQNVTPGLAQAFKLSDTQGALVSTRVPARLPSNPSRSDGSRSPCRWRSSPTRPSTWPRTLGRSTSRRRRRARSAMGPTGAADVTWYHFELADAARVDMNGQHARGKSPVRQRPQPVQQRSRRFRRPVRPDGHRLLAQVQAEPVDGVAALIQDLGPGDYFVAISGAGNSASPPSSPAAGSTARPGAIS